MTTCIATKKNGVPCAFKARKGCSTCGMHAKQEAEKLIVPVVSVPKVKKSTKAMSSLALSQRDNWQAKANTDGLTHERSMDDILKAVVPSHIEVIRHPTLLDQLFLELDYERNPDSYVKPEEPKKDDIYFNETTKRFMKWNGKSWTVAKLGMTPDIQLRNKVTNKSHLIELKKQNDAGNAHERACRYNTRKMYETLQKRLGVTGEPVSWIFTGSMTEHKKYILELNAHLPDNHYIMLKSTDNTEDVLKEWVTRTILPLLE